MYPFHNSKECRINSPDRRADVPRGPARMPRFDQRMDSRRERLARSYVIHTERNQSRPSPANESARMRSTRRPPYTPGGFHWPFSCTTVTASAANGAAPEY